MADPVEELKRYLATINDINNAAAVLGWDQRTYMPPGGAPARANQLSTLSRLSHSYSTADELARLLDQAERAVANRPSDDSNAALVRVARRDYDQARKLPGDLVAEITRSGALTNEVWQTARANNDYALFAPSLEHMFDLYRQVAEHLGYRSHPYDAVLDQYEPGMTTAQVQALFDELQAGIVPLVAAIAGRRQADEDRALHQHFDPETQLAWGWQIVTGWGFDPARGRQDKTIHPFCTSFSPNDVRITTRVFHDYLAPAVFGTFHETGHALYEQGIDPAFERGPLGRAASLGFHESQSRLWENLVGRSRPFWETHYRDLQNVFPQLANTGLADFYRAINAVQPSTIRVEADELTYNLHILLRFNAETALLTNQLKIKDVPEFWNTSMQNLLGITPDSDTEGVLQDVHWAHGLIGYFPTYTLGNVMSVQLLRAAERAEPALQAAMASGNYHSLLAWLGAEVHRCGATYLPNELIERATGQPLQAKPYLDYLRTKFGELYRINVAA